MKQFLTKLLYFTLLGVLFVSPVLASYLYFDPFKVLRQYDDYSYSYVIPNRDYISTEVFLKNYQKQHYNSFIFGSSRTLAFKPNSWRKYLESNDSPYMFDASRESIYGIYTKLKLLDSIHASLKNVLIIFCRDVSFVQTKNHKGHLFVKHPATSGENPLLFQMEFFSAYTSPKFLLNYYVFKILGKYKSSMNGYIESRKISYDRKTNEVNIIDQENEIRANAIRYYAIRKDLFYERKGELTDSVPMIREKQIFILKEIKRILEKNQSAYKIVLSPLYEQMKPHSADLLFLKKTFGSHFYDFSGKNYFTEDKKNYYETSHYRPSVGDSILKKIYQ